MNKYVLMNISDKLMWVENVDLTQSISVIGDLWESDIPFFWMIVKAFKRVQRFTQNLLLISVKLKYILCKE